MSGGFETLAISGVLAVVLAALLRQLGWSMSLPLVAAGALLGVAPFGPDSIPDPEIVLVAILAPLVFGEALGSSYLDLRKVARPVLILAIGLVIVTTLTVGAVGFFIAALPLAVAFALGAVLAPTDAVSVSNAAKRASLPRRLVAILEGESLVNDGTGLTALRVAVTAAVAGSVTLGQVGIDFSLAVVSGILVGLGSGLAMSWLLRHSNDLIPANALVIVAPFLIYIGAEQIDGSGILAIVVAGLFVAHRQHAEPGAADRIQSAIVWRHLTFILQAMAFFLIGLEIPSVLGRLQPSEIRTVIVLVVAVVLTLVITRALFVFAMVGITRIATSKRPHRVENSSLIRESTIVSWAGARGPISGLAAFSIPLVTVTGAPFPGRDLVMATSFIVIVITLILAESLGPLARRLRIPPDDDRVEIARVQAALARAALIRLDNALEDLAAKGTPLASESSDSLRRSVEVRLQRSEKTLLTQSSDTQSSDTRSGDTETPMTQEIQMNQLVDVAISMVHAEQEELIRLRDSDGLPDSIAREILHELDVRENALLKRG